MFKVVLAHQFAHVYIMFCWAFVNNSLSQYFSQDLCRKFYKLLEDNISIFIASTQYSINENFS